MKSVSTKQLSIANTVKKYPYESITVLHPNLNEHWLWEASARVRKSGACGVDGQSHADYEEGKAPRLRIYSEKRRTAATALRLSNGFTDLKMVAKCAGSAFRRSKIKSCNA
jgi:hypothetical protein